MIDGLKKLLKPLMTEIVPSTLFQGKKIGIDISGWIYSLVSTDDVIFDVVEEENFNTLLALLKLRLVKLLDCVQVLVVLDGASLPQKAETNRLRRLKSAQAEEQLQALFKQDDSLIDLRLKKNLSIKSFFRTPALNAALIDFFSNLSEESRNFPFRFSYLVSPYEADAQLSFLSREGLIDAVLTMDADLIIFGGKTIIFPPSKGIPNFFSPCLLWRSSVLFDDTLSNLYTSLPNLHSFIQIARGLGLLGLSLVAISTNKNDYLPTSLGGLITALKNVRRLIESPDKYSDLTDDDFSEAKIEDMLYRYLPNCSQIGLEIGVESFKTALLGFLGQVVYDIRAKSHRKFQLSAYSAAGVIKSPVEAEDDANGHLLGLQSITDMREKALKMGANFLRTFQVGDTLPTALLPRMISGAVLPPDSTSWSRLDMIKFLEINLFAFPPKQKMAEKSQEELVECCKSVTLANNRRQNRGQHPLLKCPFGFTLRDFYEAAKINFDARGQSLQDKDKTTDIPPPPYTNVLSVKRNSLPEVAAAIPTVPDKVIEQWFNVDPGKTTLSMVKGWKIYFDFQKIREEIVVQSRNIAPNDMIQPRRNLAGRTLCWSEDSRRVICCRSKSPATMKKTIYSPSVKVLVETDPPTSLQIVSATCTCRAQNGQKCSHVAALLYAMQQFPRSDTETEKDTSWKTPRAASEGLQHKPISEIGFFKPSLKRDRETIIDDSNKKPRDVPSSSRLPKYQSYLSYFQSKNLLSDPQFEAQLRRVWLALRGNRDCTPVHGHTGDL